MSGYSDIVMDYFRQPRNAGAMEGPDAIGRVSLHGAAPSVSVFLRVQGSTIEHATFETSGCGAAIAAASLLTELVRGRSVAECQGMTWRQLNDSLGGLPHHKEFCAALAIDALRAALEDFRLRRGDSELARG